MNKLTLIYVIYHLTKFNDLYQNCGGGHDFSKMFKREGVAKTIQTCSDFLLPKSENLNKVGYEKYKILKWNALISSDWYLVYRNL